MRRPKLEKYVFFLFCGLFVAAGVFLSVLLGQTYREYTTIKTRENYYQQRVAKSEENLKEKEEMLHRLHHDPVYTERVIRQRLGYAKDGELIFRFEEPKEAQKRPPPTPY